MAPASRDHRWAIVLAGGNGERLAALTRDERGEIVPKQYCSLRGHRSLLGTAMARAATLAPPDQILVIVAQQHEQYWRRELAELDCTQVVVQPLNRGTAAGVLLPLSVVLDRDPKAVVTLLPADHFVEDEETLAQTLHAGQRLAAVDDEHAILVGIEPDHAEPDYGWILPKTDTPYASDVTVQTFAVASFVEKPARPVASVLWAAGAVWNSFLVISRAATLHALFEKRLPSLVASFAMRKPNSSMLWAEKIYGGLPCRDFSRDVLEESVANLKVLIAPACGWTDLGTPDRVIQCLRERPLDGTAFTRPLPILPVPTVPRATTHPANGPDRAAMDRRPIPWSRQTTMRNPEQQPRQAE